jgi:hypothetical protein
VKLGQDANFLRDGFSEHLYDFIRSTIRNAQLPHAGKALECGTLMPLCNLATFPERSATNMGNLKLDLPRFKLPI